MKHGGGEFRLGSWRVRPRSSELVSLDDPASSEAPAAETVRVEGKSMEVLVDLALHAGEVRERQELLDSVWGDAFVSEEVLSHAIWDLRRALKDNPKKPEYVQTLPRRGYRLIAPVSWLSEGVGDSARYRKLERLGAGVGGEVWAAEDRRLGRRVALKFLPPEWSRSPKAKRRFQREARIVAALDHPNIGTLHDLDETEDGRLFLVMALIEGETLAHRLEQGPLPWGMAARLASGVAAGLEAAHRAGILHRDIKPSNLMLTSGGEIAILDFGLACFLEVADATRPETSPGTPAYMAPEQLDSGRADTQDGQDARADIWSLGVVLYEMLTGRRPFGGDNARAVMLSILRDEPPPLPETIPQGLARQVLKLLAKDPGGRPAGAAAVREALAPWSGLVVASEASGPDPEALPSPPSGSPSPSLSPPPTLPTARSVGRPSWRKLFLGAAACLGVVVAVILAASVFRASAPEPPPLRVAVLPPEIRPNAPPSASRDESTSQDPLALVARSLQLAALEAVASRQGLAVIDPLELSDASGPVTQVARAVAADEVIRSTVSGPVAGLARLSLFRVRASDGRVLWTDSLGVPMGPGDLRLVHEAVAVRLRRAYKDRGSREAQAELSVRNEDYGAFLHLQQRIDVDGGGTPEDLESLEAVVRTSPGLVEAYLVGADLARSLFTSLRRPEFLERGRELVAKAQRAAPHDPRPQLWEAQLLLADRRFEEAASALGEVESLAPGDLRLPVLRSRLAEGQGQEEEALAWARVAVEHLPSWQRLYRLATLELRSGQAEAARATLGELLGKAPGNAWGLAKLGELELLYGELERARALYQELAQSQPTTGRLINLALVHVLQRNLEGAEAVLQRALELNPGHPTVLLNLADVEAALGRSSQAQDHYREVLKALGDGPLSPAEAMNKAQCLVRLGESEAAVRLTQLSLARAPEDSEVIYLAALVYALAGDRTSSLVNARRALEKGVRPIWFELPAFEGLLEAAPS